MPSVLRVPGKNKFFWKTCFDRPSLKGLAIKLQKNWLGLFCYSCIYARMGDKGTLIFNFILFSDDTVPHNSVAITL